MTLAATDPPLDVDPLLDDPETRIIVCCGSGGVGKTTTAAALGCGRRSAAARSSCSPSTRRAGSPSPWASTRSTTPRAG